MHLMHFYYRLHNDCSMSLVDERKARGVSGKVHCFFFSTVRPAITFILNLCSVCWPVSYICRVRQYCYCSTMQKKFGE